MLLTMVLSAHANPATAHPVLRGHPGDNPHADGLQRHPPQPEQVDPGHHGQQRGGGGGRIEEARGAQRGVGQPADGGGIEERALHAHGEHGKRDGDRGNRPDDHGALEGERHLEQEPRGPQRGATDKRGEPHREGAGDDKPPPRKAPHGTRRLWGDGLPLGRGLPHGHRHVGLEERLQQPAQRDHHHQGEQRQDDHVRPRAPGAQRRERAGRRHQHVHQLLQHIPPGRCRGAFHGRIAHRAASPSR